MNRRTLLRRTLAATASGWSLTALLGQAAESGPFRLATFRFDVTPPLGHGCCGGWIKPVEVVDDTLEAAGFILFGQDKPMVVCSVDWTGLLNEAHLEWRTALAQAAGTTPDRVAVHCVHQHNAPLACLETERLIEAQQDLPHALDIPFFNQCLAKAREAVTAAVKSAQPVTHIAHGQAQVEKVASNRRMLRDATGRVLAMRGSACRNPELVELPEGLIDPYLKTVVFYQGDRKLVSCHYYAVHPMSFYGDGRVTSDFPGLARKQRQAEEPDCLHLYFTGCAGNIAAGKYNDGSPATRPILTQRIYDGIVRSEATLKPLPLTHLRWRTAEILPPARETLKLEDLEKKMATKGAAAAARNRPGYEISWLRRLEKRIPFVLASLEANDASLLHLPAECFIEFQLRAQKMAESRFVATAGYGDGGCWYIPTSEEYPNGGYEVSVAFADPAIDGLVTEGMRSLLT